MHLLQSEKPRNPTTTFGVALKGAKNGGPPGGAAERGRGSRPKSTANRDTFSLNPPAALSAMLAKSPEQIWPFYARGLRLQPPHQKITDFTRNLLNQMCTEQHNAEDQIQARLGMWDAISIIVGIVLGTSIYRATNTIFDNAGGPWTAMALWLVGGCLLGVAPSVMRNSPPATHATAATTSISIAPLVPGVDSCSLGLKSRPSSAATSASWRMYLPITQATSGPLRRTTRCGLRSARSSRSRRSTPLASTPASSHKTSSPRRK